jgi:2-phosphosulfolactate phosphatase
VIVDVALAPSLVLGVERKVAVVIDALRASATILALLELGAPRVTIAATVDEAFSLVVAERGRYLLCGESGGLPPRGFDYGNSPSGVAALDLAGREVVLSTSNGTRALRAVAAAHLALVGTGRNGAAVAARALGEAERAACDLTIVCAGDERGTLISLEDLFFAGYLIELLARSRDFTWPVDESNPRAGDPSQWVLDESAVIARRTFYSYVGGASSDCEVKAAALTMFQEARNGHSLLRLGFGADLDYCAAVETSQIVPRLAPRAGRFVLVAD